MKLRPFIQKKIDKAIANLEEHPLSSTDNANFNYWTEEMRHYDALVEAYEQDKNEAFQAVEIEDEAWPFPYAVVPFPTGYKP
jgi:hypothetical protein